MTILYVGYGESARGGIARVRTDEDGSTTLRALVSTPAPLHIALSEAHPVLYSVHPDPKGYIAAWTIQEDRLVPLGHSRSTQGQIPCHVTLSTNNSFALTANYRSGSIAVFPIEADGSLACASHVKQHWGTGPNRKRQSAPHPHMVASDPARQSLLVPDLGADAVVQYILDDRRGRLVEVHRIRMPSGSGPRHLAIGGDFAYVVGELDAMLHVIDLRAWPPRVVASTPTSPTSTIECFPSAIALSLDSQYCYVANRGPNSISVFYLDDGSAEFRGATPSGGNAPWDLVVTEDRIHAVNAQSDRLATLRIDPATGIPEALSVIPVGESPMCIVQAS